MLLSEFVRKSTEALESLYPSPEARGMVLLLCKERLGVESYTHIVEPRTEIPASSLPSLEEDVRRLCASEPLQYVLGETEFCGRRFKTDRRALIPRPETEMLAYTLIEEASAIPGGVKILDLCTGTGCIAWTAALSLPGSRVFAVDISDRALDLARSQFPQGGPVFVCADVLDTEQDFFETGFDFIVSNPPYVKESEKREMRSNVLDYEPHLALFVPDSDPLKFYRAIAVWAERLLKPGGKAFVEMNEDLGEQTALVFSGRGFKNVLIMEDMNGRQRFVSFQKPV